MSGLLASSQTRLYDARTRQQQPVTVPNTAVRLLTRTSKMPGPSWSLPAHEACPRANGTICDGCYASKGCYQYPSTRNAQAVRFAWTVESMRTAAGRQQWIEHMLCAIRQSQCQYFRVHDSGDMFNVAYAESWLAVCARLPDVKFWIPTRAWQQPAGSLPLFDPLLNTLRQLAQLINVTVRPSALNFGEHAPVIPGLHAGTTAAMPDVLRARQCPAYEQGGTCGDCRACWDVKDTPVSYCKH
jgi:hypothetical protein